MPIGNYGQQPNINGTGNYVNYYPQQNTAGNWGQAQMMQPMQQINNSHVMSIAPAGPRENAIQFPVAVNTDLYLINMQDMKLYFKNNPSNPSEMREFDLVEVMKKEPVSETVTRAEFEEMKSMMSQMMGMLQDNQNSSTPQRAPKNQYNGKRGNRNDKSDGVSANNG